MPRKVLYAVDRFAHLMEYHLPYLKELSEKGIEVHAAASGADERCSYLHRVINLPNSKSGFSYENFSIIRSLLAIIRNEQYDLLILNGNRISALVRIAMLFLAPPRPYVIDIVDSYSIDSQSSIFTKMGFYIVQKMLACVTDEIITLNAEDHELAKKYHLYRNELHNFSGMGLDFTSLYPASADDKAEARYILNIPEKAFVLVYEADFIERSNHEMLIEAMRFLPSDVYLYLSGDGPLLEQCREKADHLGVLHQVGFAGNAQPHILCCHAADIVVSAEFSSAFSASVLAALVCGVPVVGSNIKGNRSLIRNEENGYIYPVDNEYKFAEKVIKIYSDRELQIKLGSCDREYLLEYSLDAVKPQLINELLY